MRFLALALLAIATVSCYETNQICEPGSRSKLRCNDCICSEDGTTEVCTLKKCEPGSSIDLRVRREATEENVQAGEISLEKKKICEPGVSSKVDCNHCICSKDGSFQACTFIMCPPHDLPEVHQETPVDVEKAGETIVESSELVSNNKTDETSLKSSELVSNNTLLRQTEQVSQNNEDGSLKNQESPRDVDKVFETSVESSELVSNNKAGETSLKGSELVSSNTLLRQAEQASQNNEDGSLKKQETTGDVEKAGETSPESSELVSNNTLLRQTRQVSHNRPCEAGKQFKMYCNDCSCGSDGSTVICTKKACPEGVYNEDGSFKNPGQVANNTLLRQKRQVSHNRPCEAGKQFKMYCNDCACGSDGSTVICTKKACPEGVYNEDGSFKNPGQVANNTLLRQKRQVIHNRPCEAGKMFKIYCKDCACGSDGLTVVCMNVDCPEGVYNEDGSLKNSGQAANNTLLRQTRQVSENRPCEAGKKFKVYCNDCACGSDGSTMICTKRACPEGVYNEDGTFKNPGQVANNTLLRQTQQVSHNRPCEAGKQFKIYCNDCSCGSDNFTVICTRRACPEGVYNEDGSLKGRALLPDTQIPQVSEHKRCEPGKRVNWYCNTCACTPDGYVGGCTRMGCPEGVYNEDGSLKKPEQASINALPREKRQSMLMTIYEDGSLNSSEQVPIIPVLRQKRQNNDDVRCEPGKMFKHYCNTCSCGSDGRMGACTVMACPEGVYNIDGSMKNPEQTPNVTVVSQEQQKIDDIRCEPGKSFKMYCNTCFCGSDGRMSGCTYKACPEGVYNFDGSLKNPEQAPNVPVLRQKRQNNDDIRCEPGKQFKYYCNTCSCTPDGRKGPCTLMACPEGVYNIDGSLKNPGQAPNVPVLRQKRQINDDIRCEPGKSFKMYCNTCSCGSNGRMAGCTYMACPEGVYNFDGSLKSPEQAPNVPVLRQKRQNNDDIRCEPGKQFKYYCNTCSCTPDGRKGPCTLMACPEGVYNIDGSLKNPGQAPNVPVLRQKRQNNDNIRCEPGTMFKYFCNICSCTPEGRKGECTTTACREDVWNIDGTLKSPGQVPNVPVLLQKQQNNDDIRCEPGKIFKHYCNTCSCGSDGRMGACTIMACPDGVYNMNGTMKSV